MIYKLDYETFKFLCDKKLTFNQFMLCLLCYNNETARIIQYTHEVGLLGAGTIAVNGRAIKEIDDLIERGFIDTTGIGEEKYTIDNFIVTPKFTAGFLLMIPEDAAMELWNTYPKKGMISGQGEYNTRVMDRDDFIEKYISVIQSSEPLHNKIMKGLNNYKKTNSYAEMNLKNFVSSLHWETWFDDDGNLKGDGKGSGKRYI